MARRPTKAASDSKPSLVSLFTGAGGLDLGLEQAGFETLLANEIEPYACESLRANRVLRSLDQSMFDGWFNEQISQQRCYSNVQPHEIARLRRRLSSAIGEREQYLARAHILGCDVRKLTAAHALDAIGLKRGELDLVAGGPPCQPFSRAGKRELIESDDGQLFLQFVGLVDGLRPRWFLFENVKGLVLHRADVASVYCPSCSSTAVVEFGLRSGLKEATEMSATCAACGFRGNHKVLWEKRKAGSLDIIQNEFERIGYTCRATVLNAANYGAPQHRERLFIVGSRDGEALDWPEGTHREPPANASQPTFFDSLEQDGSAWRTLNEALYSERHWRYGKLDPATAVLWVKNVVRPHDEPVTWTLDRPAPTIGAHQAAKLAIAPFGVPQEQLLRQQWHVLGRRQGDTPPVPVEHEYLTDEELLRLQTFPASWYLFGTRMQRAFQIGNAVPPVLARAVGEAILKAMGQKSASAKSGVETKNEQRYASSI